MGPKTVQTPKKPAAATASEALLGVSIAAVSMSLGLPPDTIRSWERRFGFPAPQRSSGGHRRYSPEDVTLLRALRDELTTGKPVSQAIDTVRRRVEISSEHAGPIRAILRAAMRLRSRSVSDVLIDATSEMGAEAAVLSVAFPALREIGRWWDVGSAMVSNEHTATAGVRAWLAAEQLSTDAPVERRPVVLACGPDEMHSIGLEAFELFLVNRGWPCVTLGALTPREEIAAVVRQVDAGGVVITSHQATTRRTAIDALREVRSLRRARVFYAGRAFSSPGARMGVPGIYLGEDLTTAADLVDVTIGGNDLDPARNEAS